MSKPVSSYRAHLPAVLQADDLIGDFLLAFERILSDSGSTSPYLPKEEEIDDRNPHPPALEEVIRKIPAFFDPQQTPKTFLPWLAGWVALNLREEWEHETKRQFIQKIVPLYQKRGTKECLVEILKIYLESSGMFKAVSQQAKVYDQFEELPHYFQVELSLPTPDLKLYWRQVRIATAIIDQEKPAHTFYSLKILVPSMQLTGISYPLHLTKAGTVTIALQNIKTDATATAEQIRGALNISLKQRGRLEPLLRQHVTVRGQTLPDQILNHTISAADISKNSAWRVVLENLSDRPLTGEVRVEFTMNEGMNEEITETKTLIQEEFALSSGLKIITKENGLTLTGNTFLGTVAKQIE